MNGDESSDGQGVVPLRTILINFLNLVETYEARRNGGLDSYDSEFQELKAFSETLKGDPDFMCKEGEKNVNRKKNRYKDILPFDYTRVILSDYGDVPGSDYINANFIKGASGSSAYIASQGPLPHTVNDFWRMVVECEVQVIVMACNEQESGKHKCENYWVEEDPEEREFGEVTVWLKKCRQVCPDFLVRTMRIRFTNSRGEKEERNVCQFHYSAWPDHGVPTKVRPLLDMVRLIRDRQTSETLPVLVHCSAGCGRTGTICAIDYVWGLLRLGRLTKDFSLFTLVREMRRQRIAMVQTKDQYILVHRAVKELFQEQLKIIDSHPYANVDHEGLPFDLKRELEEPTYEVLDFTKGLVNNSSARMNDYADISGNNNINNNNHITVSVSNINVNAKSSPPHPKSSPPPLPPPCLVSNKTSPPISSLSSSADTASSSTPPATVDNGKRDRQSEKNRADSSNKKHHPVKSKGSETDTTDEKRTNTDAVLEKKNSSGSDSEIPKSYSSSNLRSALLRKPSIVKLKSFFERNPSSKDDKKPGQLSRAKSDVSTRFYNFTAFGQSRNNGGTLDGKAEGKSSGGSSSKADPAPKKPPISTKPTIPIKRSKSFKITHNDSSPLVPIVNHVPKSRKKSDDSNPSNSNASSSTTPSSSSYIISSSISSSASPIKVCVKQVEIPKLQTVLSKSIKPEVQIAATTTASHEYDYDIDDRSHLRQKPISPSVLQREALQKSSKSSPESSGKGTAKPSKGSNKALVKPEPPSRIHILKDNRNDYANVVGFGKIGPRKPSEMEDILPSKSTSHQANKYEKLKKCDTVNPRILAASCGLTSKQERSSLTRSQSHVWQPDKTQIPIRIFSDENLHQSSSPSFPSEKRSDCNSEPLKPADSSEIFIQAIHPEVKSLSSSEYHRKNEQEAIGASSTTGPLPVSSGSKPVQRRRVPKTNPYANYPACITGSNTTFPAYKISQPVEDSGSYPVNHNDSHLQQQQQQHGHLQRTGIPSLRQSSHTGGGSVGNSSDSSSNTGTPRNSSPGTPTQSVDMLYPKLYRNAAPTGRSSSTPQHSNDSSISRSNINGTGNQPKSILKESPGSTPSESEEKLDTARGFPPPSSASSNLPKINTIRIAVGLRERRNSFRQAVWKEAQPASSGNSTEGAQGNYPHGSSDFSTRNVNPFNPSFQGDAAAAGRIHKNYEPIWPDPNNCNNGTTFSNGNPFYIPSYSGNNNKSDAITSSGNPFANLTSSSSIQGNSKKMLMMSNGKSDDQQAGFHSKVDQIKVMLAELNAPVMSAESKTEQQPSGASTLKQQRSLRAPSRSHYQHGLSCFAFRKPSSYESIVDQLQHEENFTSTKSAEAGGASGRTGNDYVTLEQCRTADKGPTANGFATGSSCSPEFARKYPAGNHQTSPSSTPVPPPRTRKNHYHANPDSTYADLTPDSNGFWPPSTSNSNYSHLPPLGNQNGRSSEPRDECTSSHHEMNQNDKSSSGNSPKAIIRALGLVQAKAANVRSRWANRGGSKERPGSSSSSSSKRPLENGTGSSMESSTEEQPNRSRFHEPLCAPLLQTPTSQLASTGLVQRSKHQYL